MLQCLCTFNIIRLKEMLDKHALDLVAITSTNETHRYMTEELIRRRIAVHCQKPMGITLEDARAAFEAYLQRRMCQPHFANARSVRNALDRARLRQASRLFREADKAHSAEDLSTLSAADIRASRVFALASSA